MAQHQPSPEVVQGLCEVRWPASGLKLTALTPGDAPVIL